MGDVHGEFGVLNSFINKRHPKIILQCGDFGYWPNLDVVFKRDWKTGGYVKSRTDNIKTQGTKIYWCDGNHEDHWSLQKRETDELWPDVFYMPRGSTMELPDGRTVLFMGGADSIDKDARKLGVDWFPEEVIRYADIQNLPGGNRKIDIVISHTCPKEFDPCFWAVDTRLNDCSRDALSHILHSYDPPLWYFAHWHTYKTGYDKGCRWTCLNTCGENNWWLPLAS